MREWVCSGDSTDVTPDLRDAGKIFHQKVSIREIQNSSKCEVGMQRENYSHNSTKTRSGTTRSKSDEYTSNTHLNKFLKILPGLSLLPPWVGVDGTEEDPKVLPHQEKSDNQTPTLIMNYTTNISFAPLNKGS